MRGRPVAHALVSFVLAFGAFALAGALGAAPAADAAQSPDDFRDATTVDVLARGAKPRERLRLAFDEGSISVGAVRQDILSKQTVSGIEQPATPVTVMADLRTTVKSVDKEGVRTVLFVYENSDLPELNGAGGSYVVTDRGFASDAKFTFPSGTDTETQDALQRFESQVTTLSTPLPFAAVGVGARWKVTQHPVASGVTSTQIVVYTLVERDANNIVLRSKLRQTAPTQTIDATGLPADATATLVGSDGGGAGDLNVDLTQVVPNAATVLARLEQGIIVEQGTQRTQISQTVTTNVSITNKGSGA